MEFANSTLDEIYIHTVIDANHKVDTTMKIENTEIAKHNSNSHDDQVANLT